MSFYFIKVEIFLKQREVAFLSPSKIISTLLLYCDLSEGLIVLRHKGLGGSRPHNQLENGFQQLHFNFTTSYLPISVYPGSGDPMS